MQICSRIPNNGHVYSRIEIRGNKGQMKEGGSLHAGGRDTNSAAA